MKVALACLQIEAGDRVDDPRMRNPSQTDVARGLHKLSDAEWDEIRDVIIKHNPTFLMMNLVVSAVVLTIIIERTAFQLGRYRVNSKEFFAQIKKLVAAAARQQ